MPSLIELAEICEKAEGPSKQLAAEIRCAVFAPPGAYVKQSPINGEWCVYEMGSNGRERSWEGRGLSQEQRFGDFTRSLDAAMTLVAPGAGVNLTRTFIRVGERWNCTLHVGAKPVRISYVEYARSAALAITACALRALAQEKKG